MRERYIGSVLVTDRRDDSVTIIIERDAVCRVLAESQDADQTTLAQVTTAEVVTVSSQATALKALRLMHDGGFRHLPIIVGRRVVGIVSYTDFRGMEYARLEEETVLFETLQ